MSAPVRVWLRSVGMVGVPAVFVVGLLGVGSVGCAVQSRGSFDDVVFSPGATAVAILDAHDVLERAGGLTPVERPRGDKRVHLWLSSADLPEGEDWQHLADERLLDVKKDLARSDLLLLRDLPFDALSDGDDVTASSDGSADGSAGGTARGTGDFSFSIAQRPELHGDPAQQNRALGSQVTIDVEPLLVEDEEPRGGTFNAKVFVKRTRGVGQPPNDVASGEVIFTVALPFAPERLAEANLAFVAPIVACAQQRGPGAANGCDNVEREPITDATGAH